MYANVLIILLCYLISSRCATIEPLRNERIIGGEPVEIQDYPYQLSLQYFALHICGAVLINNRFALTAAHCLKEFRTKPRAFTVYAGSRFNTRGGIRLNIERAAVHGLYDDETSDYDIAIMKLQPVKYTASILPIGLWEPNKEIPSGTSAIVTGWGHTKENGKIIAELRGVTLPVIDNKTCKSSYLGKCLISERMLCAGPINGGSDSCQGDSGGPLVSRGKLIGLVSWGYGCGRAKYPGVYTKISKYHLWIDLAMKQLNN